MALRILRRSNLKPLIAIVFYDSLITVVFWGPHKSPKHQDSIVPTMLQFWKSNDGKVPEQRGQDPAQLSGVKLVLNL